MKDSRFTTNPVRLDRQRSVFNRDYQHKMSLEFGKLNLIGWDEVLPGDTFSTDLAYVIRMDTPVAPIMDNIYVDIYHFFVPNRLVWEHWKEFLGESDEAWVQETDYQVPQVIFNFGDDNYMPLDLSFTLRENYFDQLGIPFEFLADNLNGTDRNVPVNVLPLRGIQKIWNDYFRDVNTQDASLELSYNDDDIYVSFDNDGNDYWFLDVQETESDPILTLLDIPGITTLYSAGKFHDLFTSALPSPQRGDSVLLPLSGKAPIIASGNFTKFGFYKPQFTFSGTDTEDNLHELFVKTTISGGAAPNYTHDGKLVANLSDSSSIISNTVDAIGSNLIADLTNATAATVNQLRIAVQTQKYLEALARGGNRYIEYLKAIFGVNAPNGLLQRAEYLGGKREPLNISQVLSTAETQLDDGSNPVGQTGAYSLTNSRNSAYTKSFVEHGYVFSFCVIRQKHTYSQGISRLLDRKNVLDFYVPQLANIGEVPVKERELFAIGTGVFGYQEAWYEYRYRPDFVSGKLNPTNKLSLNYWTLADAFENKPVLNGAFIAENDDNLKRALIHGSDADVPQFIGDFYFKQKVAREMPLYSIPGLVDHH